MNINELTYEINGAIFEVNRVHKAQLMNYLKATGLNIGILVNFKSKKAEIDRVVYNLPETQDEPQSYLRNVNKLRRNS